MNKITVIIPNYNCEEYIEKCLVSVENQTIDSNLVDVIVVNDGSKDNSLKIIEKYILKHKNWILIDQENKGLSESRNVAMQQNKNEYIVFLDSDDELPREALKTMYDKLEQTNSDIVVGGMINYNSKGTFKNYTTKFLKDINNVDYEKYPKILNFVHAQSKMYRAKSIKNHQFIKNVKHEDNYFTLSLYLKKLKIDLINEIVYMHRVREGNNKSIMQSLNINSYYDLLTNFKKIVSENNSNYIFTKYMYNKSTNYIAKFLNKKDEKKALQIFKNFCKEIKKYEQLNIFEKLLLKIFKIKKIIIIKVYNLKKGK